MPLLVRAAPERDTLRRVTMLYLWLTMKLAAYDELDGAFQMFSCAQPQLLCWRSRLAGMLPCSRVVCPWVSAHARIAHSAVESFYFFYILRIRQLNHF